MVLVSSILFRETSSVRSRALITLLSCSQFGICVMFFGRQGGRKGGRKGGRQGGREGGKVCIRAMRSIRPALIPVSVASSD